LPALLCSSGFETSLLADQVHGLTGVTDIAGGSAAATAHCAPSLASALAAAASPASQTALMLGHGADDSVAEPAPPQPAHDSPAFVRRCAALAAEAATLGMRTIRLGAAAAPACDAEVDGELHLASCRDAAAFVRAVTGRATALEPGYAGFGEHTLDPRQIFYRSRRSLALVNLKPVVPGHVLVITRRRVPRFTSLSAAEVTDLWSTAQRVGGALETHLGATSLTLAIQDGPDAGQTVPHVHVHLLPRRPADVPDNDEIYGMVSGLAGLKCAWG
jgi:diadenosine tetraphosphate (Ap4A) HIT family hydrolase